MSITHEWHKLLTETEQLQKPSSIDRVLTPEDISVLQTSLITIFNRFLEQGELHKGLKIYIDRTLRNDMAEVMRRSPPPSDNSLENWCKTVFGEQKFGVVLNTLEAYDNTLTEQMCAHIAPLLHHAGLPLGGLSFLFFMGNYGFTPFGIHKDAVGEDGFLFHLGPGQKEFYTWDEEELNTLPHSEKGFHDIDGMLPAGKKHSLTPGSVMFTPHHIYHIANTPEFSMSIVMDFVNPTPAQLEQELARMISVQDSARKEETAFVPPLTPGHTVAEFNKILDPDSITGKFNKALDQKAKLLQSNGGVLLPAVVNTKRHLPNGDFTIRAKAMFPLITNFADAEAMVIYARGHTIRKPKNSRLHEAVSILNDGRILAFGVLQEILSPEWDIVDIFSFISTLYSVEAIDLHS